MTILALIILAAPGDVLLLTSSSPTNLSAGQRTTLGNAVAVQWPTVAVGNIDSFYASRVGTGSPRCAIRRVDTINATQLFALLTAGEVVVPGAAATERVVPLPPEPCGAGLITVIGTLVSALASGATAANTREFDCRRRPGNVISCTVQWAQPFNQAAAFALLQTGAILTPLGIE